MMQICWLWERVIGEGLAIEVLNAWLSSDFEGGRHIPRIEKMMALEKEQL